jgi:hypothetical protein
MNLADELMGKPIPKRQGRIVRQLGDDETVAKRIERGEETRRKVWECLMNGWGATKIAAELGMHRASVTRVIRKLRDGS